MPEAVNQNAEMDPAAEGSRAAADWHGGAASLISACVTIKNGILAFGEDEARRKAFLASLVAGKVLTADEALQGRSGSKLSMLIQIGKHEQLLQREDIAPYLMAGYTIIYQATVVFNNIPGQDEAQKVELSRILQGCPDVGATEYLRAETRRLKQAARGDDDASDTQGAGATAAGQTLRELIEAPQRYDLLALTPNSKQIALLRASYDAGWLERCLPLHQLREASAAAVIVAPMSSSLMVADKLLTQCGFDRPSRILLPQRPASSDITGDEAVITAERGGIRLRELEDGEWLGDAGPLDPLALAARLYPDAGRRLHVFASEPTEGWTSLVGDVSWVEVPSI